MEARCDSEEKLAEEFAEAQANRFYLPEDNLDFERCRIAAKDSFLAGLCEGKRRTIQHLFSENKEASLRTEIASARTALALSERKAQKMREAIEELAVPMGVPLDALGVPAPESWRLIAKARNDELQERIEFARQALKETQSAGEGGE